MTLEQLRLKVRQWDAQCVQSEPIANSKYTRLMSHLDYHGSNHWNNYLPADHILHNSNYVERLAKWIGNVSSDEEQKLLLEYAAFISYFSHEDFTALYQTALRREVYPWVAKHLNLKLDSSHPSGKSFDEVLLHFVNSRTWYCPITDSMNINSFYKVNHLSGISEKPQFSALQKQAAKIPDSIKFWKEYINTPNSNSGNHCPLEFIVLLEDIVGSGTQCKNAVEWAVATFGKPVLFIPLILCPKGLNTLQALEAKYVDKLTVRPIVKLERKDLLGPERNNIHGWNLAENMEKLAHAYISRLSPSINPFGFEGTGCSIATFSNTPDNSLPLIHDHCRGNWAPLFPRVYRD